MVLLGVRGLKKYVQRINKRQSGHEKYGFTTDDVYKFTDDYRIKLITKSKILNDTLIEYIENFRDNSFNHWKKDIEDNYHLKAPFITKEILNFSLVKEGEDLYLDSFASYLLRGNMYSMNSVFLLG